MPRYFFDVRNDDVCSFDDRGMILGGIEAARDEATRTLTEFARGVSPGAVRRVIGIEVRDEAKQPLLEARLIFQPAPVRLENPATRSAIPCGESND